MNPLSSLAPQDRRLLLWFIAIGLTLAIVTGFLMPGANSNDNPLPSTYLSGQHGARAAYETLLDSGYQIDRWEHPLSELAATASPETVVIFAEPFSRETDDIKAVRTIIERGGRVLATGQGGGLLRPDAASKPSPVFASSACQLDHQGLDPLADSGEVWMVPSASWQLGNPTHRVQYSCAATPAVVEYNWGKGHVVWWAAPTPLENGSISRANNLDLLLNSLGPRVGHHFYWDESLHGEVRSTWSYAAGPALTLLWVGLIGLGLLIIFSFSRRSGPVRDLPPPPRATPIEFLDALGTLYRKAGAASIAVSIAWERFRRQSLRLCGQRLSNLGAAELAATIRRRFPSADTSLEADLLACEAAAHDESTTDREALRLTQLLHDHHEMLLKSSRPGA